MLIAKWMKRCSKHQWLLLLNQLLWKSNSQFRSLDFFSRFTALCRRSYNFTFPKWDLCLKQCLIRMKIVRSIKRNFSFSFYRPKDAPPYEIKTSFPNRVYDDPNATLQECGLVPNATLHLLVKKVWYNYKAAMHLRQSWTFFTHALIDDPPWCLTTGTHTNGASVCITEFGGNTWECRNF